MKSAPLLALLATASALAAEPEAPTSTRPAWTIAGTATGYAPLIDHPFLGDTRLEMPLSLAVRADDVAAYPIDRNGTAQAAGVVVNPRLRLGLRFTGAKAWAPWGVQAEYEHDLPTGALGSRGADGVGMPGTEPVTTQLRKLNVKVNYGSTLLVGAGVMTSHWGLGLVANDGAHDWEPGSARFVDPRGGDRVLRGFVATGPHTSLGLVAMVGVDRVLDDDSLLVQEEIAAGKGGPGDTANQLVGAVSIGQPGTTWAGLYVAYRGQTTADGRGLKVTVIDASVMAHREVFTRAKLSLGAEAAFIAGESSLAPTPDYPSQRVSQLGVAARAGLDLGGYGAALDGLFASGDRNLDDGSQNAFRADPNYELGLLLFRQVLAAQTGRAPVVAGDPLLVGAPAPGLDRFPTRGAATNTFAVFPRAFVRPVDGVEVYGGVLVAWAQVPPVDPFNTRVAGGTLRDALDGAPGNFLGTELDLGARGRFLVFGTELTLGLEAGYFLPGDAFRDAAGKPMAPVVGGRAMLSFRL